MVYLARVVDNREFGRTGTIEVMLPQKYADNGYEWEMSHDLADNFSDVGSMLPGSDINSPATKMTYSCLVSSPMPVGYNTGSFALPQINTLGFVLEIDNAYRWSSSRYIWLGGLYGNFYGREMYIPRDDTADDSFEYKDIPFKSVNNPIETEEDITGSPIMNDGQMIIRTKASRITDWDNADSKTIGFENIPSDNTFVMDKNKISLRHNKWVDLDKKGFSGISFDNDSISIKRYDGESDDKRKEQRITINDTSISIEFDNKTDSKKVTLSFDSDGNVMLETTGGVNIHSEGDISMKSDKKISIVAKEQAKFEGNGVDLGEHLKSMSEHYEQTQTTGAPTSHKLAPGSITAAKMDSKEAQKGFII